MIVAFRMNLCWFQPGVYSYAWSVCYVFLVSNHKHLYVILSCTAMHSPSPSRLFSSNVQPKSAFATAPAPARGSRTHVRAVQTEKDPLASRPTPQPVASALYYSDQIPPYVHRNRKDQPVSLSHGSPRAQNPETTTVRCPRAVATWRAPAFAPFCKGYGPGGRTANSN
jgi:hypothetical protein